MGETSRMTLDECPAAIRDGLLGFYIPEGVEVWLNAPHSLLGGERARDVIRRGEADRVLTLIDQLESGGYV